MEQYDYYGMYATAPELHLRQRDVKVTTTAITISAIGDDVYIYTGVSPSLRPSNIGFLLSNPAYQGNQSYQGRVPLIHRPGQRQSHVRRCPISHLPPLAERGGPPTNFDGPQGRDGLLKMYAMDNEAAVHHVSPAAPWPPDAPKATVCPWRTTHHQLHRDGGPAHDQEEIRHIAEIRSAVEVPATPILLPQGGDEVYYPSGGGQPPGGDPQPGDQVAITFRRRRRILTGTQVTGWISRTRRIGAGPAPEDPAASENGGHVPRQTARAPPDLWDHRQKEEYHGKARG